LLPVGARVLGALRAVGAATGDAARTRRGAASRPDGARYGDFVLGGRLFAICCAATGFQRCPYSDGGAVPRARRSRQRGGDRMSVLIRGVVPYGEGDQVDVLVDDGQIAEIGPNLDIPEDADVIDASGQVLLPGFVDLHTHLREPGREYAEDIESGSAAAALGGYTAVFAMANTNPVADSPVVTDHVWHRGQQVGLVDVHPVGAVTMGLAGAQLTEMGMMAAGAGQVRMFSDDGICVDDPLIMRRALEYATGLGVLIAQH